MTTPAHVHRVAPIKIEAHTEAEAVPDNTLAPITLLKFKLERAELRAAVAEEQLAATMWDVATSNRMVDAARLAQNRRAAEDAMRKRFADIRHRHGLPEEANFDVDLNTGTISEHTTTTGRGT